MLLPFARSLVFAALAGTAAAQGRSSSSGLPASPTIAGVWALNPALT